jgi:ribosomal protein L33
MAKGKRTYMSLISTESGIMWYITNVQKKNLWDKKLELKKYDKKLRKHVIFKMKETKH